MAVRANPKTKEKERNQRRMNEGIKGMNEEYREERERGERRIFQTRCVVKREEGGVVVCQSLPSTLLSLPPVWKREERERRGEESPPTAFHRPDRCVICV